MAHTPRLISSINDAVVDRVLSINSGVRKLNLSKNVIHEATEALAKLGATLQSLDLSFNKLEHLSRPFQSLRSLTSLYASDNLM